MEAKYKGKVANSQSMFQFIKKRKIGTISMAAPEMNELKSDTEELMMNSHSSTMEQINPLVIASTDIRESFTLHRSYKPSAIYYGYGNQ